MTTVLNKPELRALRSEHAARYTPRAALPLRRAVVAVEDIRLRRLTAQVLEQLKRPDAIPSRILMTALSEAKALGRS